MARPAEVLPCLDAIESLSAEEYQQRARADWFEEYGGTVLAEAAAGIFFLRFYDCLIKKFSTIWFLSF